MNSKVIVALGLVIAAGAGMTIYWHGLPGDRFTSGAPDVRDDATVWEELARSGALDPALVGALESLQSRLATLQEAHDALSEEVVELRRSLSSSDIMLSVLETDGEGSPQATGEAAGRPRGPGGFRSRRGGGLTQDRLTEAGFTSAQATQIIERFDEMALERLDLRYQAAREGWLNTPEYRERMADLPDAREVLESEYGGDAYDRYLYASGRPNRVVVTDIYQGSAASQAGLQAGDMLIEFADQRVYRADDLMSIATQGSEGSTVPLVVQRDGALVQLYVSRGPLGITTRRGYENPE